VNVIKESRKALKNLDWTYVDRTVEVLRHAEQIFCVGNGGGAAHATHFAADLRKIADKRAHSFDSLPEVTARINDDGWEAAWHDWSGVYGPGLWFLFSVGGGRDGVSANLPVTGYGIVGERGRLGARIVIPSTSTPVVEGCQSVIAHHIVEQLAS
jgi:D-sedoheptulose 7-phosphate isomerase